MDSNGTKLYSEDPVREVELKYTERTVILPRAPLDRPKAVAKALGDIIDIKPQEFFCVVSLDVRMRPVGVHVVSIGTQTTSLVHPREVFRTALYLGAHGVIVAHSHPSGEVKPSPEDIQITGRLVEAGIQVGISVLDHVIVAGNRYYSFHEDDKMPTSGGDE